MIRQKLYGVSYENVCGRTSQVEVSLFDLNLSWLVENNNWRTEDELKGLGPYQLKRTRTDSCWLDLGP